ncbi:MAG: FprA family A-type flavoprotein [Prevotella sp.]|uniref:FprA family A-type flavoprotein n=1 Tax=Prevotella sp. P5-92 TaxID=2024222 RepID=UPI000B967FF2|nr:FprA family A-type flavoprotein [Prevotella sp. P5-92]MDD6820335.1 FprA family A-type flavoprotein [Prevotella sp.]MDY4653005.1 FprA family A-type flavoprotein [Prevotella sp.]OYP58450.1 FprA family A-type flavoprotein [Prevotella sp. P5-92]
MQTITDNIYYVGVNDRNKHLFEGLWPLPNGVSYNSYIIDDEKVCLIDTVEVDFFIPFIKNIQQTIGDRPIDYLVINHMEPDHSGSMELIRKYYPNITIVGNKKTFGMMKGFYGISKNTKEVKNGDVLDLGSHKLQFVLTPMVHWPETMVTLDTTANVLFSGDAFGCFGALNGGILDSQINCDTFWLEMVRYYSNIVGKYGTPVQNALKKLAGVKLDYICSTHGPVWHENIGKVISMYDSMSKYETEPGLVICYGTMYGNTERAAEAIARAASEAGVKNIVMYNVSKTHHSYIIRDVFRYNGLIVGAPTYNTGLYHEMEVLLSELANRDIKNHYIGWFGNYGWASKAVGKIQEWNETRLHFEQVGEPVEICQSLNELTAHQCEELGINMAEAILK